MTKAYKISWGKPLQIVPFAQNFGRDDISAVIKCIFDCGETAARINNWGEESRFFQYLNCLENNKIYKLNKMNAVIYEKETYINSYKSNEISQSLTEIARGQSLYQRHILPTWEDICEKIKISMKLYSSILDKCRYTSLELAVQAAARMAYPIAKFRTSYPVKVGSSDNNK